MSFDPELELAVQAAAALEVEQARGASRTGWPTWSGEPSRAAARARRLLR